MTLLLAAAMALPSSPATARTPGLCAAAADGADGPVVAVVSAFPAELAPILAAAEIAERVDVDGRTWAVGRLAGVRVVLGLLGIGMVNADARTRSLLARFDVAAIVLSGVAGSPARIGDVVVPGDWTVRDTGRRHRANPALAALAPPAGRILPERCTPVPPTAPDAPVVCMPFDPVVVAGGHGTSGDDFGGAALACVPGGDEIFGCALPATVAAVRAAADAAAPDVVDMETAAVARVAARARVPFLGIRGVSDGAGDPRGDRGFPAQFLDYYRLAARNAASVARAVVAGVADVARDRRTCRLLARGRWSRAAARIAARDQPR